MRGKIQAASDHVRLSSTIHETMLPYRGQPPDLLGAVTPSALVGLEGLVHLRHVDRAEQSLVTSLSVNHGGVIRVSCQGSAGGINCIIS